MNGIGRLERYSPKMDRGVVASRRITAKTLYKEDGELSLSAEDLILMKKAMDDARNRYGLLKSKRIEVVNTLKRILEQNNL